MTTSFNPSTGALAQRSRLVRVQPGFLTGTWRSKRDIFNYLAIKKQYFLPSYRATRVSHLRDLLSGKKKALHRAEVR